MISAKIEEAADYLLNRGIGPIDLAIVLGTGFNSLQNLVDKKLEVEYDDIPHFPISTVPGHSGKIVFGTFEGKSIALFCGRFHYYEGYDLLEVTFYVHVLHALGCRALLLTNAAGGLNPNFNAGDLVLVEDHIHLFPASPLRGWNDDAGHRFTDMLNAYDPEWRSCMMKASLEIGIHLHQGVYLGWQGPHLETPAEYRMLRIMGADLVGMSSTPEVIVARYYDMKVAMVSVVSNECLPIERLKKTKVEDIIAVVEKACYHLTSVIGQFLRSWPKSDHF